MPEQTFFLKSRPPLRAFLIAAVLSLLGAVLLVIALRSAWHTALVALCAAILGLGIVLLLVALIATWRLGVRIKLTDEGYSITGTNQAHAGNWADVTKITQAVEGAHLTIYHGNVVRTHLIFPGGSAQAQMEEIVDAIMERVQLAKEATPAPPRD